MSSADGNFKDPVVNVDRRPYRNAETVIHCGQIHPDSSRFDTREASSRVGWVTGPVGSQDGIVYQGVAIKLGPGKEQQQYLIKPGLCSLREVRTIFVYDRHVKI